MTRRLPGIVLGSLLFSLIATAFAAAQNGECRLVPDDRNPPEHILRCGEDLSVRPAAATRYRAVDQQANKPPAAVQLDSGALIIEFHPTDARKDFQILTPHAIAAVRGTRWAVEVTTARTSVLVLSGEVAVAHLNETPTVVLHPGEGADIASGRGRIEVKRWAKQRVRALLARFGK